LPPGGKQFHRDPAGAQVRRPTLQPGVQHLPGRTAAPSPAPSREQSKDQHSRHVQQQCRFRRVGGVGCKRGLGQPAAELERSLSAGGTTISNKPGRAEPPPELRVWEGRVLLMVAPHLRIERVH